eukprot:scaffold3236_cov188-Ochromonas_danica.AAC.5
MLLKERLASKFGAHHFHVEFSSTAITEISGLHERDIGNIRSDLLLKELFFNQDLTHLEEKELQWKWKSAENDAGFTNFDHF